tara:strand:- start:3498 stop:3893 length:396 start_codon:yes stop_codon:yes gene_type:complete
MAFGLTGLINLSGTTGLQGTVQSNWLDSKDFAPGSGAGGGQGALLVILDGGNSPPPQNVENRFTATTGATPIQGTPPQTNFGGQVLGWDSGSTEPYTGFNAGYYLNELQGIVNAEDRKKVSYQILYLPETT